MTSARVIWRPIGKVHLCYVWDWIRSPNGTALLGPNGKPMVKARRRCRWDQVKDYESACLWEAVLSDEPIRITCKNCQERARQEVDKWAVLAGELPEYPF